MKFWNLVNDFSDCMLINHVKSPCLSFIQLIVVLRLIGRRDVFWGRVIVIIDLETLVSNKVNIFSIFADSKDSLINEFCFFHSNIFNSIDILLYFGCVEEVLRRTLLDNMAVMTKTEQFFIRKSQLPYQFQLQQGCALFPGLRVGTMGKKRWLGMQLGEEGPAFGAAAKLKSGLSFPTKPPHCNVFL